MEKKIAEGCDKTMRLYYSEVVSCIYLIRVSRATRNGVGACKHPENNYQRSTMDEVKVTFIISMKVPRRIAVVPRNCVWNKRALRARERLSRACARVCVIFSFSLRAGNKSRARYRMCINTIFDSDRFSKPQSDRESDA